MFVNLESAADNKKKQRYSGVNWLASALVLGCLCAVVPMTAGQSSPSQPTQNIPDAPSSAQPPTENPEPSPTPIPQESKPTPVNYLPARYNTETTLTAEVTDSGLNPSLFEVQSK